jgi:ribosomal protein L17
MIEAITIYLATGAPFGVSYFLQRKPREASASSVLRATAAAFFWPLSAATLLLARRRRRRISATSDDAAATAFADEPDARKIECARRQLIAALYKVEELSRASSQKESKRSALVAYLVRESVEKYTGLMMASTAVRMDAAPATREMELCRISGRTGDDLLLAGRCVHRRNVARLLAHRERARTNLLHALAEVRELSPTASAAQRDTAAARRESVALLRFYAHAVNLLSLLEDETAARAASRLLDAGCARLRRLENPDRDRAPEEAARATTAAAGEEEECTPHIPHLAFIGPSQNKTLPQG